MIYDYRTDQVTFDFRLIRFGCVCKLVYGEDLPLRVGGVACSRCKYYSGDYTSAFIPDSYVKCKHPDSKDSDNTSEIRNGIAERFKAEAQAHMFD